MKKILNKKVLNIIIVTLIILLCATVAIDLIATAKYQTTVGGTATASVAKWSFKVLDGIEETTDVIDFAITRTDSNTNVPNNKLAPGTHGQFEIGIDASGTETMLKYTIDVTLENAPRNIKFYSDSEKTQELTIDNNVFTEIGYMTIDEVDEIKTETIYWDWPYETGENETEIGTNDIEDTEDAGKEVTMQISVTGTQVYEETTIVQKNIEVTEPLNGTSYAAGEEITLTAYFNEDVYAGESQEEITAETAPVMTIKFDGTAIAKLASTNNNISITSVAEENGKVATFSKVEGNKIKYVYTVEADDIGNIELVSYTGKVYNSEGQNISVVKKELSKIGLQLSNLADVVEVGDYVNYNASSNGVKTFTSSECLAGSSISGTISTGDSFNSAAPSQWRVLSVDKVNGIVELMAADSTEQTVTLTGGDGLVNAEDVLNNIGAIYGHGKGAESGRSITLEDVEQYSSYDPYTYENENSSTGYYGGTKDYTSGTFYKEVTDNEGNVIGYEDTTTAASSSSPVTMTQTHYSYTASSYFSNSTIYNMIFKNSTSTSSDKSTYWLASRCVDLGSSYCDFRVRIVNSGSVYSNNVYCSNGYVNSPANRVLPVVSLKSNIQTSGKNSSGVWQLKAE